MPETGICPTCSAATLDGVCRACAFSAALAGLAADETGPDSAESSAMPAPAGYQLLRQLGSGAMGIVWLARERNLDRLVALKIIGAGAGRRLAQRLIREGQSIARLRHPCIVSVHALGENADGAWLAMDFLAGGDLRSRLARSLPGARRAAGWMHRLSDALEHAHAEGVLHRDIKPSNVLLGGDDEPHLADFGLAAPLEGGGDLTLPGQVAGTAAYLAPELLGGADRASVASDIYGMGALLYECLTGRAPFIGDSAAAILSQLQDRDPPPPRLLRADVPRDLETICLKCLEKIPARRYASAAALRDDIARFLRDEPIEARPVGRAGRVVRWCRRRPATAALAGATAVLLLGLSIGGPVVAMRLARANARATAEAASSRAVSEFLGNDLLARAAPDNEPDRDIKLRTVLDRAANNIEGRFPDQPLVEASLRVTLADTYRSLGEHAAARSHRERALAIYERQLGPRALPTLQVRTALASDLSYAGRSREAAELGEQTVIQLQEVLGLEHATTLDALNNLAGMYRRDYQLAKAEEIYSRILSIHRRQLGNEAPKTLEVLNNLGVVFSQQGKFAEAGALQRETLEHFKHVYGPEHPRTTALMSNLGVVLHNEGKLTEAEEISRLAWEIRKRVLGPEHPDTVTSMNNVALICAGGDEDKRREAEALCMQIIEIRQRVSGADHPDAIPTMMTLGRLQLEGGRSEEAGATYRQILELARRVMKPGHVFIFASQDALGEALFRQGRLLEAEAMLRESLQTQEKFAPGTWRHAQTQSRLGAVLAGFRRFEEAEPLLLAGFEALQGLADKIPARDRVVIAEAEGRVNQLYADWDRPERAKAWRERAAVAQSAIDR